MREPWDTLPPGPFLHIITVLCDLARRGSVSVDPVDRSLLFEAVFKFLEVQQPQLTRYIGP